MSELFELQKAFADDIARVFAFHIGRARQSSDAARLALQGACTATGLYRDITSSLGIFEGIEPMSLTVAALMCAGILERFRAGADPIELSELLAECRRKEQVLEARLQ